jgi:hypothetical protein
VASQFGLNLDPHSLITSSSGSYMSFNPTESGGTSKDARARKYDNQAEAVLFDETDQEKIDEWIRKIELSLH